MEKNVSRKHHYLPRHYLEGFTDSSNAFFVYDKHTGKIFQTNPDGAFFENNLNTVVFPNGASSDFLEGLYTEFENQSWAAFDKIRQSTFKTPIQLSDKMHLFLFLLFLYWRLPTNNEMVEKLSAEAFKENTDVDFFRLRNKNGENAPEEIVRVVRESEAFRKVFKQIVPFAPFFKDPGWSAKLLNWRFLYTGDEKSWNIVGDNPIILKGNEFLDPANCLNEFVFPVSGKILLISLEKPLKNGLPPEFTVEYSAAIINNAERFAACQNREFLEALVRYYGTYVEFGKINIVKSEMFRMLAHK
jgi:hypothetical protein